MSTPRSPSGGTVAATCVPGTATNAPAASAIRFRRIARWYRRRTGGGEQLESGGEAVLLARPGGGVAPLALEDLIERLGGLGVRVHGEETLHIGDDGWVREPLDGVDHANDRVVGNH